MSSIVQENRIIAAVDLLSCLSTELKEYRNNHKNDMNNDTNHSNDSNDMNDSNDTNHSNDNDTNNSSIESGLEILFQFNSNQSNQCTSAISIIRESAIFPENVSYSLKRLVRGLSSSRDGARLGFATALKEVSHIFRSSLILLIHIIFSHLINSHYLFSSYYFSRLINSYSVVVVSIT